MIRFVSTAAAVQADIYTHSSSQWKRTYLTCPTTLWTREVMYKNENNNKFTFDAPLTTNVEGTLTFNSAANCCTTSIARMEA